MELVTGQIVYSKAGRDQKRCFVVLKVEGEYVYLADGDLRKVETPKKKKGQTRHAHCQPGFLHLPKAAGRRGSNQF